LAGQEIFEASVRGDLERVEALLAENPQLVGARDGNGQTPLHVAVWAGRVGVAERLLAHGADPNLRNEQTGFSAVDLAFQRECRRRSHLTRFLLSRGGELVVDRVQRPRMNALDYAVNGGNAEMVRLVVELGAEVTNTPYPGTPLSWAALEGRTEIVEILASAGADLNAPDPLGGVPLRWAVERGHVGVVRSLLAHGADPHYVEPVHGRGLLHLASLSGHPGVVQHLLDSGLAVSTIDRHGRTPLDYASRYGHRTVAERLAAAGGVHGEKPVESFGTPLHLIREMEAGEAVAWFLNHRGWAVRTREHILVFDAEEFGVTRPYEPSLSNGFLTREELSHHEVISFFTTYHGATGEPAYVHELERFLPKVTYIQNGGDGFRGSPGTVYLLTGEETTVGDVGIRAVEAGLESGAQGYLVEVDGLRIYYAGFRAQDRERFVEKLQALSERVGQVDLAFLPIPEMDEENSDFKDFLTVMNPRAVLLLDLNRRQDLFPAVAERVAAWGFDSTVFAAQNPGDAFVFK
jgi:ankyrin repeat protein